MASWSLRVGVVSVALLVLVGAAGFVVGQRDLRPRGSPEIEYVANEIVATQQFETGKRVAWLEGCGLSYGVPDRPAIGLDEPGVPGRGDAWDGAGGGGATDQRARWARRG